MDVISYFALQCSRTPLNLYEWFRIFTEEFPFENTKDYALKFRNFYNHEYLNFFSMKYQHLISNKNNILIVPLKINSTNENLKSLISVSEHNTINLLQCKKLTNLLKDYPDELLHNIDMTVVSSDLLYFCIILPNSRSKNITMYFKNIIRNYKQFPWTIYDSPMETNFYSDLLNNIYNIWNSFSLFMSYEYLICSKQDEALNFMSEQLFYFHKSNQVEEQYKANNYIEKLLLLEKHLK